MILKMYVFFLVLSLILLGVSLISRVNSFLKCIFLSMSMGLFAYLALSSYNVTSVFLIGTTKMHVVLFEDYDAIGLSWLMILFFSLSLILFMVSVLMTFQEYKKPRWKRDLERLD